MSILEKMVSLPYENWFGHGDVKDDVMKVMKKYGEPLEVLVEDGGFTACVIYADRVVVTGYDGSEYQVYFKFKRTTTKEGN